MKHYWLYVLTLEKGKHYVGITTQTPEKRFQEHVKGIRAAKWTMKYKPEKILDSKDLGEMTKEDAEAYENRVVRKYMKEKGYNNTRGGDLTDEDDYVRRFGYIFPFEAWEAITTVALLLLIIGVISFMYYTKDDSAPDTSQEPVVGETISSYQECVDAGYPVMESYPEQCAVPGGETFVNSTEDDPLPKRADQEIFEEVVSTFQLDESNIRYFWIYSDDKAVYATKDQGPGHFYVYKTGVGWELAGASVQAQLECTRDGVDDLPLEYRPPCVDNNSLATRYVSDGSGETTSEIYANSINYPESSKRVYIAEE